jgi:hypothetical protein
MSFESGRGSRHEYERVPGVECPQGCANIRGLRRVIHHTGEMQVIDVPGGTEVVERTERWIECPTCGWVIDT